MPPFPMFRQDLTILAGIPQATLLVWQGQLQAALLSRAIGKMPVTLSYTQGDGSRSVSNVVASEMQASNLLLLVNRCLGLGNARRPMRFGFR